MAITLVRDPNDSVPFAENDPAFWPISFDRIADGPVESFLAAFDMVIPADGLRAPPSLTGGARVALHCTRLEALEHLVAADSAFDIVFQPTLLERLDRHRALRPTLAAERAMDAGHRIAARDLAMETGGSGMSADLKAAVIGRVLLYDLASGSAIDFGMIGEREEEPA
jgi:hypothetical protein